MLPAKPTTAPPRGPPPSMPAPKPPQNATMPGAGDAANSSNAAGGNGSSAAASSSSAAATTAGSSAAAAKPQALSGKAAEIALAQQALDSYAVPEVSGRYKIHKLIGKGAYGAVYTAYDTWSPANPNHKKVAVKHIVNAFVSPTDARRIYREIKVMAHFSHPNILPLLEVIKPRDAAGFSHIYLVSELMETDLHRVIHSRQDLTSDHISYFCYQTLCALKHIHTAGVLHRDLKPSNLLVNADCTIRMCDFGLARESEPSMSAAFTEYVVTRWYRAPEVLLSGGKYKTSVDVWSVGCVLAELLLRRPLFPGDNYLHQLQLITEVLGSPSETDLHFVRSEAARNFMLRLPRYDPIPLAKIFPHVRGPCLDLLARMLTFDPEKRISVDDALLHPFLARVRAARKQINEESVGVPRPFKLKIPGGSAGLRAMTVDNIKSRFYGELCGTIAATPTPSSAPTGPLFDLVGSLDQAAVAPAAGAPPPGSAAAAAGIAAAAATASSSSAGSGGGSMPAVGSSSSSSSSAMLESPSGSRADAATIAAAAGASGAAAPVNEPPKEWRAVGRSNNNLTAVPASSLPSSSPTKGVGGRSSSTGGADDYDEDPFNDEDDQFVEDESDAGGYSSGAGGYGRHHHHGSSPMKGPVPPAYPPPQAAARASSGGMGMGMDVDGDLASSAAGLGISPGKRR